MRSQPVIIILALSFISILAQQCSQSHAPLPIIVKMTPDDPFKNTMAPSQHFELNADEGQVLEGKNGTLLVCPKGCFIDADGDEVNGTIHIELCEALKLPQMILSNLTTTSNGKLLETDGMLFINATSGGKQLAVNKTNPIHIEIPTRNKRAGMMAYKGSRDSRGNMNWIEPRELDNFLITVDFSNLDFLPAGFADAVLQGLPFRGHTALSRNLSDSLYFSLHESRLKEQIENTAQPTAPTPANAAELKSISSDELHPILEVSDSLIKPDCGIDPATIQVIQSSRYRNTFIATREFESRLRVIFHTCNKGLLELYIKNLDRNLFEVDSMAADLLQFTDFEATFRAFAAQRLTNVKEANESYKLLNDYFDKQLSLVRKGLDELRTKAAQHRKELDARAAEIQTEYRELLTKRETYRMKTYGFDWTETGWINIDTSTLEKDWGPQRLNIFVENSRQFDAVYCYVIYTSIKSLYKLSTIDNQSFSTGSSTNSETLMPKKKMIVTLAIGYKNGNASVAKYVFESGSKQNASLTLTGISKQDLTELLTDYDQYAQENKVSKDLEYMDLFAKETGRQQLIQKEEEFLNSLRQIAFPCCNKRSGGAVLYQLCTPCHAIGNMVVGPALSGVTSRHSMKWLIEWTRDPQLLIKRKDPEAIQIFSAYNQSVHSAFPQLSENEIRSIYEYINALSVQ